MQTTNYQRRAGDRYPPRLCTIDMDDEPEPLEDLSEDVAEPAEEVTEPAEEVTEVIAPAPSSSVSTKRKAKTDGPPRKKKSPSKANAENQPPADIGSRKGKNNTPERLEDLRKVLSDPECIRSDGNINWLFVCKRYKELASPKDTDVHESTLKSYVRKLATKTKLQDLRNILNGLRLAGRMGTGRPEFSTVEAFAKDNAKEEGYVLPDGLTSKLYHVWMDQLEEKEGSPAVLDW